MTPASLTTASYLVLGLVKFAKSTTPYELKSLAAETVGPFWSLPHTQIYAQCDKLVEAGLLDEQRQEEGRRRRVLTITEAGRRALREWLGDDSFVPIEARDLGILKLFFGADPAVLAPTQVREHSQILRSYERVERTAPADTPAGIRAALEFGLQYERWMVNFWTDRMNADTTDNSSD